MKTYTKARQTNHFPFEYIGRIDALLQMPTLQRAHVTAVSGQLLTESYSEAAQTTWTRYSEYPSSHVDSHTNLSNVGCKSCMRIRHTYDRPSRKL